MFLCLLLLYLVAAESQAVKSEVALALNPLRYLDTQKGLTQLPTLVVYLYKYLTY